MNARNAAYIAYLKYLEEGDYLIDTLEGLSLDPQTFRLSVEIACGTCRWERALWHYLKESLQSDPPRKKKEQALLLTGLYQLKFCQSLPPYATVDEMVAIAKHNTHESFVKFLNQALRKGSLQPLKPQNHLGIRYSCPDYFVDRLIEAYGKETAEKFLRLTQEKNQLMARFRGKPDREIPLIADSVGLIDRDKLKEFSKRTDVYIQNITPVILYETLKKDAKSPNTIIDLCASPGGKLILAHDFYPKAKLTANDVSEKKLTRLKENLDKYQIEATLTCGKAEEFPLKEKYDKILLDVPCSNTGVLHKKPEAKWRLSKKDVAEHVAAQKKLLAKAKELLAPNGEIWYTTCSILREENENIVEFALGELNLSCRMQILQHPNSDGYDGGFAASFENNKSL